MFINKTVFKRMVKTAYEGMGITVSLSDKGMIQIVGGGWILEVDEEAFSKEIKAALIEVVGNLPKKGMEYRYQKGNEVEKDVLDEDENNMTLWKMVSENGEKVEKTRLYLATGRAVLGIWQDSALNKFYVKEAYVNAVDTKKLEEDEAYPIGPDKVNNMILWHNDSMAYAALQEITYFTGERDTLAILTGKNTNWKETEENAM